MEHKIHDSKSKLALPHIALLSYLQSRTSKVVGHGWTQRDTNLVPHGSGALLGVRYTKTIPCSIFLAYMQGTCAQITFDLVSKKLGMLSFPQTFGHISG